MDPIVLARLIRGGLNAQLKMALDGSGAACRWIMERFIAKSGYGPKGSWLSAGVPLHQPYGFGKRQQAHRLSDWVQRLLPIKRYVTGLDHMWGGARRSPVVAGRSGNLDAHLWSILDHCRRYKETPGIKVILICPMNVLASEQVSRIAAAISQITSLHAVRAGIYADVGTRDAVGKITSNSLITDRETMRRNPPDILLTDYKMLDHLLLHAREAPLWRLNAPDTLRFLMVEDLHRFGDAQRTDLARLIRNLKYRLGTPEGHLICIGSLGTPVSDDALKILQQRSAQPLLGARFEDEAALSETRDVLSSFRTAEGMDQYHGSVRALPHQKGTFPSQAVLISGAAQKGAALVGAVAEGLSKMRVLWVRITPDRGLLADRVTSLVASARSGSARRSSSLSNDRLHIRVRKMAHKMVTLLARLGRPTPVKFGFEGSIEDIPVESHLEKRFLDALSKLYGGNEALKPQVLPGGRRGFVLRAGTSEAPRLWTIEPQVNIDIRYPGLPQKRVDFLLTPIGRSDARPIAITIDQSDHHARSVGKDVLDCIEMIRSGALYVWSLSCRDLELDDPASSRSFSKIALGPALVERLERVLAHPQFAPHADGIAAVLTGPSLQGLQCLLDGVVPGNGTLQSALIRVLVATGQPLEYLPVFSELSEAGQRFLAGPGLAERIGEGAVVLYLACAQISSTDLPHTDAELRLLLRADLPGPGQSLSARSDFSDICDDLWRLVHLFQGVRGFHLEIRGLEVLPPPVMSDNSAKMDAPVAAWRQARALCDVRFHPLIAALIAAEVPVPDRFGEDLVSTGRVVGRMEFGWSEASVAVSEQCHDDLHWRLICHDPERAPVEDAVTEILVALQESQ